MPNGDEQTGEYNPAWCKKEHERVDQEFVQVWDKFKRQDRLMWGTMLALIGNLGGIITLLAQSLG